MAGSVAAGAGGTIRVRRMVFDLLADAVMVLHLAFIVFVAIGSLLAWRWPWLVWLHVLAAAMIVAGVPGTRASRSDVVLTELPGGAASGSGREAGLSRSPHPSLGPSLGGRVPPCATPSALE